MNTRKHASILICLLSAAPLALAQGGGCKVGVIQVQGALATTKEGQKAGADLESRLVAPKRKEFESRQAEIQGMQAQLQKPEASADQKDKLARDIDTKSKALKRDVEDTEETVQQEQGKVLQVLGGKMMQIIEKYSKEKGYCIIFDVSAQNSPVLFASSEIDVTKDIVDLYDKAAPAGAAAAPTSAAPKPPAAKPPAAPPAKKP